MISHNKFFFFFTNQKWVCLIVQIVSPMHVWLIVDYISNCWYQFVSKPPSWEIVSSKCQPETYLKESILELWKLHSNFSKQKNHWEVRSTKVIIKLFLWKLQVPWVGDLVCGYNGILHASWGEGSLLVILSKCYIVVLFKLEIELASLLQTGPRYKCKKKVTGLMFRY